MKNSVLVALADQKFLDQAKQLFSTAYWNSGWSGDYLLLVYETPESDLRWFLEKGIKVKHCEPLNCISDKIGDKITACKCYLFSEFFKQWDNVVYLDVDIVTRGSFQGLVNLNSFSACHSLGQTLKDNLIDESRIPKDIWDKLSTKYSLSAKAFNSGVMAFPTSIIHKNMFEDLLAVFNKYVKFGLFGGDQLPFNIYFHSQWSELPLVYNQIAALNDDTLSKDLLQGLIIHCVSFGNGPWDKHSLFYEEWKCNFDKADSIDLCRIPNILPPSTKEIQKRSKSVLSTYLTGGRMSVTSILNKMLKAGKLTFTNPSKIAQKVKFLLQ